MALYVRRNRPDRRNVEQQSSAQISFLKMYYEYVVKCKTADIPENEKDVWDMRKLDIVPRSNPIRGRYRLDFREIRQKEFKEIIKKILYSHCQTKAMGSIKGCIYFLFPVHALFHPTDYPKPTALSCN